MTLEDARAAIDGRLPEALHELFRDLNDDDSIDIADAAIGMIGDVEDGLKTIHDRGKLRRWLQSTSADDMLSFVRVVRAWCEWKRPAWVESKAESMATDPDGWSDE